MEYPNNKHIYADTVFKFFNLIQNNDIPPPIKKFYNASFVFGLEKDPLDK